MSEIIIRFKDDRTKDKFISQMMDGLGEGFTDFTHWHKEDGKYVKKYCPDGRLFCSVNYIEE